MPDDFVLRIGIDLGGTKTEVAVLDATGKFLLRRRAPTPREDYPATVSTIARLVFEVEQETGARCSVGVCIPGSISPATGRVRNANSTWLNGRSLLEDLQAALGRPVRIQNDANCLAMSEATDGAAAGARCVFAVILGTGVGAGICIGGGVHSGRNAIAGEWGHNTLPPWSYAGSTAAGGRAASAPPWAADESPGPVCWCGRRGCIETWLSGPALATDYRRAVGLAKDSQALPDSMGTDAQAVFRLAEQGDAGATAAVQRWLDRLARSLAGVINLLDPDVIVLGGGLSNVARIYDEVPRLWEPHIFSDQVDTPLVVARHGDSSGVRGAAWLWNGPESSGLNGCRAADPWSRPPAGT